MGSRVSTSKLMQTADLISPSKLSLGGNGCTGFFLKARATNGGGGGGGGDSNGRCAHLSKLTQNYHQAKSIFVGRDGW